MNILVCISRTPSTTAKIEFDEAGKEFKSTGVQYIMNPYDEWYALVRAIELKEEKGGEVTIIHVGPPEADQIIRKALAIGADKAIRVNAESPSGYFTAKQIAAHATDNEYNYIFTGKETIDYNGSETGGMIAAHLGWPFISYATQMDTEVDAVKITRDIEGGEEICKVSGPCVISAAKGLAEQRIPNMRGIMMAKRKPLEVIEPVAVEEPTELVQYSLPEEKGEVMLIDPENMEELVRLLRHEAKVI